MMTVSARVLSASKAQPAAPSLATMTSVSTRFLAQPKLTNATLGTPTVLPVVHELQGQLEVHRLERGDDFLQIVFVLSGNSNLLVLELRVDLELERFDALHQRFALILGDAAAQGHDLPHRTAGRRLDVAEHQCLDVDAAADRLTLKDV